MKKDAKKSQQSTFNHNPFQVIKTHYRYPVPLPEMLNIDALATMSDDDLGSALRRLFDDRDKVIKSSERLDTRPWDEELAYIKREQQIRRARHEAHEKWIRELDLESQRSEANLPTADLDNSSFVNASARRERYS